MNLFKENNIKIFANILIGMFFVLTLISFVPDTSFAEGTLKVGETSGNGLWTRTKEFFSPYNNGQNTYTPNTYGGSYSVGSGGSSYSSRAPRNFYELIMNTIIGGMLRPIVTLLISGAVVIFLYGVFKFIRSDGKEKETGKEFMVWGLVGIFVMVSVWGLVNILRGTFNLNDSSVDISKVLLR
jgi:hypothetical protein